MSEVSLVNDALLAHSRKEQEDARRRNKGLLKEIAYRLGKQYAKRAVIETKEDGLVVAVIDGIEFKNTSERCYGGTFTDLHAFIGTWKKVSNLPGLGHLIEERHKASEI